MAKRKTKVKAVKVSKAMPARSSVSQSTAVIALIMNIIIPGLGTLFAKKTREGLYQILIAVLGFAIIFGFSPIAILGFAMLLGAWIWAIVRGIKLVSEAFK